MSETNTKLATRDEFNEALETYTAALEQKGIRTLRLLLQQVPNGFDGFPPHLKEEIYLKTGLRPVEMFARSEPYTGNVIFGKPVGSQP